MAETPVVAVQDRASRGTGARRTGGVRHLGTDDCSSQRVRVVDAALRCVARQGVAKTTVDDIARECGLSRATLYRTFGGGKDVILAAVVDTEVARLFSALAVTMGEARDLEDVLVNGIVHSARAISSHRALGYLGAYEPGVLLPHLAFAEMDRVLHVAGDFAAPFFARWLDPDQASRAAEWATRIVISYIACPGAAPDLTTEDGTRHLVRTFVLPGIQALRSAGHAAADPDHAAVDPGEDVTGVDRRRTALRGPALRRATTVRLSGEDEIPHDHIAKHRTTIDQIATTAT